MRRDRSLLALPPVPEYVSRRAPVMASVPLKAREGRLGHKYLPAEAIQQWLIALGYEGLELVRSGSESLIFAMKGERQRNFVIKVDTRASLELYHRIYQRVAGDETTARSICHQRLDRERTERQRAWRELRRYFPEAHIPTTRFLVRDIPLVPEHAAKLAQQQRLQPAGLAPREIPPVFPTIVMHQRQESFPREGEVFVPLRSVPFRQRLERPEGVAPNLWKGEQLALQQAITELDEMVIKKTRNYTREEFLRAVQLVFPRLMRVLDRMANQEEWNQLGACFLEIERYQQHTRRCLDFFGTDNISLVRSPAQNGDHTPWNLAFIDPFFPHRPEQFMSTIDDLTLLSDLTVHMKAGDIFTHRQQDLVQYGTFIYQQILELKTACEIFSDSALLQIPGLETLNIKNLRRLAFAATKKECL